jgi:threonine/homoserine/homoserine lactone efflux protein
MRRYRPVAFVILGFLLVLAGFIYDVMFAGIPYPDPTPALADSYARRSQIASGIRWVGAVLFLVGVVDALIRFAVARIRRGGAG